MYLPTGTREEVDVIFQNVVSTSNYFGMRPGASPERRATVRSEDRSTKFWVFRAASVHHAGSVPGGSWAGDVCCAVHAAAGFGPAKTFMSLTADTPLET